MIIKPYNIEINPYKTTAHLIVEKEGGILAPDSADPWPSDVLDRIDPDIVEENLNALQTQEASASEEDLKCHTELSGFYFSPKERALLARLGETSLTK